MKVFFYDQNNSFGRFDMIGDPPQSHNLAVIADSLDEANTIAASYGVYFDGVNKGIDCLCCGDRWREPDIDDMISIEGMRLKYGHDTLIVIA